MDYNILGQSKSDMESWSTESTLHDQNVHECVGTQEAWVGKLSTSNNYAVRLLQ